MSTPVGADRALFAWVPRGVTLDDAAFAARHRALRVILLLHVPALLALALLRRSQLMDAGMLYGGLGLVALLGLVASPRLSHRTQACLVGSGLILAATTLVHASGGLTDVHFHFFVMLALVSLYQDVVPFVLAVVLVAVHHLGMGLTDPTMVFSDPRAQAHPLPWALMHAAFVLAMCAALMVNWRFTEHAEATTAAAREAAAQEALAEQSARAELAAERAEQNERFARDAATRAEEAEEATRRLADLDITVRDISARLGGATEAVTVLLESARTVGEESARALVTARSADEQARTSAATLSRLSTAAAEISTIARSIAGVTDQTNLLALNATIEAARAGEAGKGFAVVANEVKELAREAAAATERIEEVVAAVRDSTRDASGAVETIGVVLAGVTAAQETIVLAAEQQLVTSESTRAAVSLLADDVVGITAELASIVSRTGTV